MPIDLPSLAVLWSVAAASIAAVTDLRSARIPNALTYPTLCAGPCLHGCAHAMAGITGSLIGLAVVAAVPLLLHRRGAMGGGDVKLFAGLGGLLGARGGLEVQWVACGLLALYALLIAAWHGQLRAAVSSAVRRLLLPGAGAGAALPTRMPRELPMGGAILIACLIHAVRRVAAAGAAP